jgi:predicted nucleic acid-binding protein
VEAFLAMPNVTILPVPPNLVTLWLELVRRHPVTRGRIFDLQLIATMLAGGVSRIFTFDSAHFEPVEEIEVLQPE